MEIWVVEAGSHARLAKHANALGSEDWSAIARIRHPEARDHARATRIALRLALSHAVQGTIQPGAWRFQTNSYGKPRIAPGLPDVQFCVSHTETMSLIAVSREAPVGIDIETIAPACDGKLIDIFCSARERRALASLGDAERRRAFARLWTLKEAYAKLTGTGLATDFRYLEFKIDPRWQSEGHQAQHRPGEASFESWLVEAPGGLCQASVAIGEGEAAEERGEIVCYAVASDGRRHVATQSLEPGRGMQSDLTLS
ncbi:MAG: 4'-phosphopantetheinyl transferase superfamily protein [Hyphomicrobiaceae bacterium]|nr:MAG: 4'-phosphopantetheinyl transferase superfamily protein [Hyphomicrobiaceae bacterium]